MKLQKQTEVSAGFFTLPEARIAGGMTQLRDVVGAHRQLHMQSFPQVEEVIQETNRKAEDLRLTTEVLGTFPEFNEDNWRRIREFMLLEAHEDHYAAKIGTVAHVIGPIMLRNVDLMLLRDRAEFEQSRVDEELQAASEEHGRFSVIQDPKVMPLLVEGAAARSIMQTVDAFCGPEVW